MRVVEGLQGSHLTIYWILYEHIHTCGGDSGDGGGGAVSAATAAAAVAAVAAAAAASAAAATYGGRSGGGGGIGCGGGIGSGGNGGGIGGGGIGSCRPGVRVVCAEVAERVRRGGDGAARREVLAREVCGRRVLRACVALCGRVQCVWPGWWRRRDGF